MLVYQVKIIKLAQKNYYKYCHGPMVWYLLLDLEITGSNPSKSFYTPPPAFKILFFPVLEFKNNQWGLGTE